MRVLFTYSLVGRGGDAVQVLEIAQALRNLGHDVQLLGPTPLRPYDFSTPEGRLRNLARRLPWWAKDCLELGMGWRLGRQAEVHARAVELILHRAGIYDRIGARLADAAHCPLVAWLDAPFPIERAFRGDGYFAGLHRRSMLNLGEKAQRIITVSRASKEYYVQLGLPEEKILIVPNGITERLLQRGLELARAHPPFARAHDRVLGFVGSLSPWHGVGLLLEALRDLEHWRLQIIGYGEAYASVRAQAHKLGLGARVEWLGALPHDQAFEQIAQFDIAVLPHTLPTGAPMKLFEYAALARPTIAPDLPNLRELFSEDEMCFVPPGSPSRLAEAILSLSRHPQEAVALGQRAQARVHQYTWEAMMKKLLAAIWGARC
jgi:glycosyltransferase involved in cell wall biosynthesis